jgi:hypothetical protein
MIKKLLKVVIEFIIWPMVLVLKRKRIISILILAVNVWDNIKFEVNKKKNFRK